MLKSKKDVQMAIGGVVYMVALIGMCYFAVYLIK